jgi:hypothetical protein
MFLYDTIVLNTSTGRQTLQFFNQAAGKSQNFSNFQAGTLQAGESMVLERVLFFMVTLTATNLTLDATAITDIIPFSQLTVAQGTLTQPGSLRTAQYQISIANQLVVKYGSVVETSPMFNPATTGISVGTHTTATATTIDGPFGYAGIVQEAPPVLPPNQGLEIDLQFGPVGTVTGTQAIMCVVSRFGSIFSSKTTL